MNKKRYVLNDIYWVGTEDGKILMPFVIIKKDGKNYYYNLKDKVLVKQEDSITTDVTRKYRIDNLKYYPSYDFLIQYEKSGINSIYINMLANELFEPVYSRMSLMNEKSITNPSRPISLYMNFMNHYDFGPLGIKKFYLFARAVLHALYKQKKSENKSKRESR